MKAAVKKPVRIAAYVLTFAVGMWGGSALIKLIADNSEGNQVAHAMVSKRAPAFQLPDTNDVLHDSQEWSGKVRVLNFWATWCPPCRAETPAFVALQEQYAAKGVQFVGIAIDDKDKVQDFMDTYGVNYPMLIGEQNAIEIAKAYGNRFGALPYTVIVDRNGTIHLVQRGELKRELAEQAIGKLL